MFGSIPHIHERWTRQEETQQGHARGNGSGDKTNAHQKDGSGRGAGARRNFEFLLIFC